MAGFYVAVDMRVSLDVATDAYRDARKEDARGPTLLALWTVAGNDHGR